MTKPPEQITIVGKNGVEYIVKVHRRKGHFALTDRINQDGYNRWVVTHLPTGMYIWVGYKALKRELVQIVDALGSSSLDWSGQSRIGDDHKEEQRRIVASRGQP
jgi:hypothetical protein